jgi:hypothetical protein
MKFRIPTWTGNQFVPGELYHYIDVQPSGWMLSVNGKAIKTDVSKGSRLFILPGKRGMR